MLAMCMVLLPIGNRIERQFPATTQAIYADDRSFVSPEPLEALKVRDMWHENTAKKLVSRRVLGKNNFFIETNPSDESWLSWDSQLPAWKMLLASLASTLCRHSAEKLWARK